MGWSKTKPSAFGIKLRNEFDRIARGAALIAMRTAILTTPVDTGRLRANWQLGIGEIPEDKIGSPTNIKDSFPVPTEPVLSKGSTTGKIIYIVNNLPYAEIINDGNASRKGHRMVELALKDAKKWVDEQ